MLNSDLNRLYVLYIESPFTSISLYNPMIFHTKISRGFATSLLQDYDLSTLIF